MEIKESHLKIGGEVDFGYWGRAPNRFRLSLRWNKEKKQYEIYRAYARLDKDKILVTHRSQDLHAIVKEACAIANKFSKEEMGEEIYHDTDVRIRRDVLSGKGALVNCPYDGEKLDFDDQEVDGTEICETVSCPKCHKTFEIHYVPSSWREGGLDDQTDY